MEHTNTYLLEYKALNKQKQVIKQGKFRVKNKPTELAAKIGFEQYLEKTLKDFKYLGIISCKIENDIFKTFNDIFGGFNSNPFNNFGI